VTRKAAPTLAASLRDAIKAAKDAGHGMTFRAFLESRDFCGLKLSPTMAAIADASDGRPITTIDAELVKQLFRCEPEQLPTAPPKVMAISAGGRSGKSSRLLAPRALYGAWFTPLRLPGGPVDPHFPKAQEVGKGEHATALIVAPKRDVAEKTFSFVRGIVEESPILRAAVVGEPRQRKITLRRPDGINVDVMVIVADKGGLSARGKTILYFAMDEASFFGAQGSSYVNDADIFDAAEQRVVPYGAVWVVSTPLIEGVGLLEGFISTDWGTHKNALVVARCSTRLLNPNYDPDGSIEAGMRARPGGALNADREILAIPFPRGSASFFPADAIAKALDLMPDGGIEETGGGVDLGHGHDNSALAIVDRRSGGLFCPRTIIEILSGPEQAPSDTYKEFAQTLTLAGVRRVSADAAYKANFVEVLRRHSIVFIDAPAKDRMYDAARKLLVEGKLALGGLDSDTKDRIAEQMRAIYYKNLPGGRISIFAPRQKIGEAGAEDLSGHCDSVSALVAALAQCGSLDPQSWNERKPKHVKLDDGPRLTRFVGHGSSMDYLRSRSAGVGLRR
jgi:hypothetical protein